MSVEAIWASRSTMSKISNGSPALTLLVPDGKWVVTAKLNLDNDDTTKYHVVTSTLTAGVDRDVNHVRLAPSGIQSVDNAALAFTVAHEFAGTSQQPTNTIQLHCQIDQAGANVAVGRMNITAIRVDSLSKQPG